MKDDRFLTVILIVIALLVVASIATFFLRQDEVVYLPEDTPEAIVHNYILAITDKDYERAYAYLAEGKNKPSYDDFESNFLFNTNNSGYKIGKTTTSGSSAYVEVTVLENSGGVFFDRYDYVEIARLLKQDGEWKLIQMPYAYWAWGWYEEEY